MKFILMATLVLAGVAVGALVACKVATTQVSYN